MDKPDTMDIPTRQIVTSSISKEGKVRVRGLSEEQALLCISHVKEEVPGSVRRYITLPEAHSGMRPQVGYIDGPVECNPNRWTKIWSMTTNEQPSKTKQRSKPENQKAKRIAKRNANGPRIVRYEVSYIRRYGKPDQMVRRKTPETVDKPSARSYEKSSNLHDSTQKEVGGTSRRK